MDELSERRRLAIQQAAEVVLSRMAKQHAMGVTGLLSIYPKDKLLWGSVLPAIVTIIVFGLIVVTGVNIDDFLKRTVDTSVSILPNLLGFLLGGYTILIGFGNASLLKSATHIIEGRRISLFQMLSTIFALTIYLQSITLAAAVIAQFTLSIPLSAGTGFVGMLHDAVPTINKVSVVVFLFLLFYSILSLKDTVVNVFNFAQRYHYTLTEERLSDEYEARKKGKSNDTQQ
ncbi:hypothetical protein [Hymenobacter negativus]|uniref:Uncharacterized protein n=1 Tax=Hymenobacter negativus TaxID=2795026 RepID=A0ABS3QD32_9BACT|nr:hypothetical protein [Hymenobacter negativus]MBO2009154.1 hypothetical protein [Hymenobacter negativus]